MPHRHTRALVLIIAVVLAVIAAACDSSGGEPTTSTGGSEESSTTTSSTTTTTVLTSLPPGALPGSNSPSIPEDVAQSMRDEIGVMVLEVEESRGLPFLEIPTVTILDETDFTTRVNQQLESDLDNEEIASLEALYKLLGMLTPDDDLRSMLVDLYTEQVAGFYDPVAAELVVPVSIDGITPLQEITIAHELVHALTDQHFDFNDLYEDLVENGTGDDAAATLALVEGDATYQQLLYLEAMDPTEAAAAALESLTIDQTVLESMPPWLQQDLTFPYESGFQFTMFLVGEGGLKIVDEAYQEPPISTEQILDPNKYLRDEQPETLAELTVELTGWDLVQQGAIGEWGTRLILMETLTPGDLVQAAAGWGNDNYRFFTSATDATFVWSYLAETEADAEDLTNALIVHARDQMGASGSREDAGGLFFDGGSPVVFIDRIDDAIFFIASTDGDAVADVRQQLGI